MSDLSPITGPQKLNMQLKVSLETTQKQSRIEPSLGMHAINEFETKMEEINHAFALVNEIRSSLESALDKLN